MAAVEPLRAENELIAMVPVLEVVELIFADSVPGIRWASPGVRG
jgi:hypothetical protein